MEPFERTDPARRRFEFPSSALSTGGERRRRSSRPRTPPAYRFCDGVTEGILYAMIIFTPWAYGTTQEWSIWTMNVCAYLLGALLLAKRLIRWRTGYQPERWGVHHDEEATIKHSKRSKQFSRALTFLLAVLTCFTLSYILVSAINKRAVYLTGLRWFEDFEPIRWLPYSFDAPSTWQRFWAYLGLACFFWALRDWLLAKTPAEHLHHRDEAVRDDDAPHGELFVLPRRLQRLLWVLCINGGLLAIEGILQRLSGTNKLLWLLQPTRNNTADAQFGPYAYRSNAAQYFNLLWPTCLGFWMALRQKALRTRRTGVRIGEGSHVVLLPLAVLMASCPVISTSRGGALVSILAMFATMALLFRAMKKESARARYGLLVLFLAIVSFSGYLGWNQLALRLKTVFEDQMSQRPEIYRNAVKIAADYPHYGTGAGTFGALYQLYREDPGQTWAGYAHDDWLETRITLGWLGFGVVLAMLACVLTKPFGSGGVSTTKEFLALIWVSLGGCLLHAKFDFPMQIYSVLFAFLLLCSLLFCLTLRRA